MIELIKLEMIQSTICANSSKSDIIEFDVEKSNLKFMARTEKVASP